MADDRILTRAYSRSAGVPGRSINSVRVHHFVIDEPASLGGPGEEVTPAEAFLAAVSACGVLLVETFAREEGKPLRKAEAWIEGAREASNPADFVSVALRFALEGASQADAEHLVGRYKER